VHNLDPTVAGSAPERNTGMDAYLQGPNGEETELTVTEPSEADGSFCVHLPDGRWVRLVPNS
jgi:hypothetical protein